MKKLLILLFVVFMAVPVFAEQRVYTSSIGSGIVPKTYTGSQQITSVPTFIVDAAIYYKGVTVGDYVQLRNGTSSDIIVDQFYAPTANGYTPITTSGFYVDSGLYYTQGATSGTIGLIITYK